MSNFALPGTVFCFSAHLTVQVTGAFIFSFRFHVYLVLVYVCACLYVEGHMYRYVCK